MFRTRTLMAVVAFAALAAGLIGAGAAAMLIDNSNDSTTTVVRETAVGAASNASTAPLSVANVYRRAAPGVVEITVTSGSSPFGGAAQAQGSGFVYDSAGHIVTNEHVVDGATSVSVRLASGARYRATVIGTDPSTDLAVIKIDAPASQLHPLTLADSSTLVVGAPVVAIGSPFGLEGTITSGIISSLHREIEAPNNFTIEDAIQTDAAINHGNSGGPLLDLAGHVIGVNAQIKSDSGGNEGVGFAVPSSTVRTIVSELLQKGSVQHAYLGVSLAADGSARIDATSPGEAAQKAGLQAGDVVTKIDGASITSGSQLRGVIDGHKPGDKIRITVRRNGSEKTVTVTLGTRPATAS
jgi:putative serine protease PepD